MKTDLRYGSQVVSVKVPERAFIMDIREPEGIPEKSTFTDRLKKLLNGEKRDYRKVGIVVSDKTRLCGYELYLPWLLEVLEDAGADSRNIRFYIAYGTHSRQTDKESLEAYGGCFSNYAFVHHDCSDASSMVTLGKTTRGTPVTVRNDVLESSLLITFGAISHHYFAGFGGGRKLLFPGLAQREAIYHNHSLFLNMQERKLHAGCRSGALEGNPVAEDLFEVDAYLPPRLAIHGILNSHGKVCQLLVGSGKQDFLEACKIHDAYYKSSTETVYDCVVASSGGYPKDINFIQAHKSIHHAASFVRDGGTLVVLSECRDGIGTDKFLPLFKEGGWNTVFEKLARNYEGNGGTALAMMAKAKRIAICMVTGLDEATCRLMGVKKISLTQVPTILAEEKGTLAVIRNASLLIK